MLPSCGPHCKSARRSQWQARTSPSCTTVIPMFTGKNRGPMINLKQYEVWFVTGSQHLYGPKTLEEVAVHSQEIARTLSDASAIPVNVIFKPVLTTPDAIRTLCLEANAAANCVGLIAWMHTFSPAKMWIGGLTGLTQPPLHLHTQKKRDNPWS